MTSNNTIFHYDFLCIVGVHARERTTPQRVQVEVELHAPTLVIDERALKKHIKEVVDSKKPFLIENMSYEISKKITKTLPQVRLLSVKIKKVEALKAAVCAYVTLKLGSRPCVESPSVQ